MDNKINSNTKIFGLIGNPINHSFSPIMHNAAFKYLKFNAIYHAFLIKKKS